MLVEVHAGTSRCGVLRDSLSEFLLEWGFSKLNLAVVEIRLQVHLKCIDRDLTKCEH